MGQFFLCNVCVCVCVCLWEGFIKDFFSKVFGTALLDRVEFPAHALLIVFSRLAQLLHRLGLELLYCTVGIEGAQPGENKQQKKRRLISMFQVCYTGCPESSLKSINITNFQCKYNHQPFPHLPPPPQIMNFKVTQFQNSEFFLKNKLNNFSPARRISLLRELKLMIRGWRMNNAGL